jgi:prepilin-type N-terminal cleavage/methylation domain-containing protein
MPHTLRRQHRAAGFTLIETLIVVSVISILATIAIPNLLAGRAHANQAAAVATLRTVATAQFKFKAMNLVDMDYNNASEYGTFGEMTGLVALRGNMDKLAPNLLSVPFADMDADGRLPKHGYYLALYLPDANGQGIRETPSNNMGGVDPNLAADYWTCLAWPTEFGRSGSRTFFVNQQGDILKTEAGYSGKTNEPPAGAALIGVAPTHINSQAIAVNQVGADGNTWLPVN